MCYKKISIGSLSGLIFAIIFYQPAIYSWGLSKASIKNAFQSSKHVFIKAGKQVAPILIADGLLLFFEVLFNRFRAGAYGNRVRAAEPIDVPADQGLIAPGTVPAPIARIIRLMNEPDRLRNAGGNMWKSILLTGKPGIGKTQLGYYIARETRAKVMYKSAAGLINEQQGSGPAAVRELFDRVYHPSMWTRFKKFVRSVVMRIRRRQPEARVEKPVVLILDEIDAIGCKRQDQVSEAERAREAERVKTLEQLFTEVDGAYEQTVLPKVFVIGTTNRPLKLLDEGLVRPGRLRPLRVPPLNEEHRLAVLRYHAGLRAHPLADDVDFADIARQTEGYSGVALRELLNTASIHIADQQDHPLITHQDLLNVLQEEQEIRAEQVLTDIAV